MRWFRTQAARCRHEQDGAVMLFTGLVLVVLFAVGAVAVDLGRLGVSSRDQQGATDRAALDALNRLLDHPGSLPTIREAAETSLIRNAGTSGSIADGAWELLADTDGLQMGHWDRDAGAWGYGPPNAVRVLTQSQVGSLFLPASDATSVQRSALAVATGPIGTISARTSTARLNGGLLQAVASEVLNTDLDLGVLAYDGTATLGVRLADLLDAGANIATVDELLAAPISVTRLANVGLSALVADGGDVGAEASLFESLQLIEQELTLSDVTLGEVLHLSTDEVSEALDAKVDVLQLINASAQVAAREHGAIPLNANLVGVADAKLHVLQPERIAVGPAGPDTVAETSQVRLDLTVDLSELGDLPAVGGIVESILGGLLSTLGNLLGGTICWLFGCSTPTYEIGLGTVGLTVDLGYAHATLSELSCPQGRPAEGDPTVALGESDVELTTAGLGIDGNILTLFGDSSGAVELKDDRLLGLGEASDTLDFEGPVALHEQLVGGTSLSLSPDDLLGGGALSGLVGQLTSPLTDLLNAALLGENGVVGLLLDQLGLDLGMAEVGLLDVDCTGTRILVE